MIWMIVYAGLGLVAVGVGRSLVGVRWRRRRGLRILAAGIALCLTGLLLPAPDRTVPEVDSLLDRAIPTYQFWEFHSAHVDASCDRAFAALLAVTAAEIRGFQTLTWIRRLGRPGPENILNAPAHQPLLSVATSTTFREIGRRPGREILIATVLAPPSGAAPLPGSPDDFRRLATPGDAKAALSFEAEPAGDDRCRLTTETRVYAADAAARRRFAAYWRVIYPGSALIRRMWLQAIARRAVEPGS